MAATSCCVVRMGFSSLLLTILVAQWRWISEEQVKQQASLNLAVRTMQRLWLSKACTASLLSELLTR